MLALTLGFSEKTADWPSCELWPRLFQKTAHQLFRPVWPWPGPLHKKGGLALRPSLHGFTKGYLTISSGPYGLVSHWTGPVQKTVDWPFGPVWPWPEVFLKNGGHLIWRPLFNEWSGRDWRYQAGLCAQKEKIEGTRREKAQGETWG